MNPTVTSATTSRQKRIRTDPITTTQMIDLTIPAPTTKTTRSPTKSAIQALEGITASLPSSLHPLVLHFGNKLISIRSRRITKENIAKHMTKEPNYIPKSAKATDFKITLSKAPWKTAREFLSWNNRYNKQRTPTNPPSRMLLKSASALRQLHFNPKKMI